MNNPNQRGLLLLMPLVLARIVWNLLKSLFTKEPKEPDDETS